MFFGPIRGSLADFRGPSRTFADLSRTSRGHSRTFADLPRTSRGPSWTSRGPVANLRVPLADEVRLRCVEGAFEVRLEKEPDIRHHDINRVRALGLQGRYEKTKQMKTTQIYVYICILSLPDDPPGPFKIHDFYNFWGLLEVPGPPRHAYYHCVKF